MAVHLQATYKKAAKMTPAKLSPIIGSNMPAAAGEDVAGVALPLARVAVPVPVSALVPDVTDLVTVADSVTTEVLVAMVVAAALVAVELLPARALLMMLASWLAEAVGTGMAIRVVLGLGGATAGEVLSPTGIPDGPVGTKLAGVVTAAG